MSAIAAPAMAVPMAIPATAPLDTPFEPLFSELAGTSWAGEVVLELGVLVSSVLDGTAVASRLATVGRSPVEVAGDMIGV